eukprot:Tbor_TRINITY_DN5686_c1_g1::TRINITY_DN5686_c1_g1_i11::g.9541::m.9541
MNFRSQRGITLSRSQSASINPKAYKVTQVLPDNPMSGSAGVTTMVSVIFTVVLLASNTQTATSAVECYSPGTTKRTNVTCTCKPPYRGLLCNLLDYEKDGIHYQSLSSTK